MTRCDSCEALMINGLYCHEHGCPEAWRTTRECKWCGQAFEPESRWQVCCDDDCSEAYRS